MYQSTQHLSNFALICILSKPDFYFFYFQFEILHNLLWKWSKGECAHFSIRLFEDQLQNETSFGNIDLYLFLVELNTFLLYIFIVRTSVSVSKRITKHRPSAQHIYKCTKNQVITSSMTQRALSNEQQNINEFLQINLV